MKHFKTYGEFLNETTRQKGKDLNKKELRDLLNKAEDMFHNTNWKRVELAKLFNNLNKQDREKLAIDSQVPILKDILRNESVNEGFHTFDGEMAMDLEDRGTKLKRGDKVTLEIQPNYYVIYGPNRKQISLDKIDFDPETLQQYVIYESVNKAKVKVGDILYKDGRKGKVVKVMSDMANVDFGGGDVYGITFRRIKGDQIEESVNEAKFKEGQYIKSKNNSDKFVGEKSLKEDRKAVEYIRSIEDEDEREEERKRMFDDEKESLKEYTSNSFKGSEVISSITSPDIFAKKAIEDLFPSGVASEGDAIEALKSHDASPTKARMGRFAPMFVHVQYHDFESGGEEYRAQQTQYYNSNFKDTDPTFNPKVTKLSVDKMVDGKGEEIGTILVKTDEYLKDLKDLNIIRKAM